MQINFSVTQNGKPLKKSKYNWDENTRTFSTKENNLVLDFRDISGCTFDTGGGCTFDTGSACTFNTGSACTFDTGWDCTFKTGSGCTFDTGWGCTFDTGKNCIVVRRDFFEIIKTKENEILKLCPFKMSGFLTKKENETDFCMEIDGNRIPHIIADGILSKIIKKRTNNGITVYKVINYGADKETYIVFDGENYSHGKTLKAAKDDLKFKIGNRDTSMYNDYTLDMELTLNDAIKMYRKITGACEAGTKYFVANNKLPKKATVREVIKLTEGQYNNQKLKEFFESEAVEE